MSKPFANGLLWLGLSLLAGCSSLLGFGASPSNTADSADASSTHREASVPRAAQVSFNRGLTALKQQNWQAAEADFNSVMVEFPDLPGPRVNLAIVYRHTGRAKQAEELLSAAVSRWPDFAPGQLQYGLLLTEQGRFAEADAAYERALKADPGYAAAYYNRAVLNELYLQDLPVALQHYEKYQQLQKSPDPMVGRWIDDLQRRTDNRPQAALPSTLSGGRRAT